MTYLGQLRLLLTEFELAEAHGRTALEEHRSRGDTLAVAVTLEMLGNVALCRGDLARAQTLHTDAAGQLRELGNPGEVACLLQLGLAASEIGQAVEVRRLAVPWWAASASPWASTTPAPSARGGFKGIKPGGCYLRAWSLLLYSRTVCMSQRSDWSRV